MQGKFIHAARWFMTSLWIMATFLPCAMAQTPVYSGLWLPESYFPSGFRSSPYGEPTGTAPLRSNGTQVIEYMLPAQGQDDLQEWITVFIDSMSVYPDNQQAVTMTKFWADQLGPSSRTLNVGDEAHLDPKYVGQDSPCRSYLEEGRDNFGEVNMRKLLLRAVKVGQMTLGIRVNGERVRGLRKEGNFTRWFTVRAVPSCEGLETIAAFFAEQIRLYGEDQGWMPKSGHNKRANAKALDRVLNGNVRPITAPPLPPNKPQANPQTKSWPDPWANAETEGPKSSTEKTAIDDFDAWKRDHLARGWRYVEKDGFAEFIPRQGAVDDKGWIYSEAKGTFLPPETSDVTAREGQTNNGNDLTNQESGWSIWNIFGSNKEPEKPVQPRDGDVNDKGEVWSDEDGGWIGRNLYEQEKARRAYIKSVNERPNEEDKDIQELKERIRTTKLEGKILQARMKDVEAQKELLDAVIEQQISEETDPARMTFLRSLQKRIDKIDITDEAGALSDLSTITADQVRQTFEPDYSMKQFLAETGALTLDAFLTKGAATASLYSYQATQNALEQGASTSEALWEGAKTGAVVGGIHYIGGKVVGRAFGGTADDVAKGAVGSADDLATAGGKLGKNGAKSVLKGNWNSSSQAIQAETRKKLLAKLPANHPARQIGKINETLGKAGRQFDARKINPLMRLDQTSEIYKAGIEALKKNPRYLSTEAKIATDAVRHDLDLAARERAIANLYKARPDLKGHLTHFENTGSHARKGMNYRGLESDIDFTPKGTVTAKGREAERLFSKYYKKAVPEVSGGKLTVQNLKAHAYGGDKGTGAFKSDLGLKTKDVMNQTSGRVDKLGPDGKITHSLRGDDILAVGKPTRIFDRAQPASLVRRDVQAFKKDLLNKFREELPEMGSQKEKLVQAAKGYKLSRIIEAKAPGGRALSADRYLYKLSKQIKERAGKMSPQQQKALTEKFLKAIEQ